MNTSRACEKIAILGGGFGGLSAAFELSDPATPQDYDITVYQLGWRLGGKGASGRNQEIHDRIEEHGIHAFFGFYENAFDIMQRCYEELDREPGAPLATWELAFERHDLVVLMEQIEGQWFPWPVEAPRKSGVPGFLAQKREHPTMWQLFLRMLGWIRDHLPDHADHHHTVLPHWWAALEADHGDATAHPNLGRRVAHVAHRLAESLDLDPNGHHAGDHHHLRGLLAIVSDWLEGEQEANPNWDHTLRHLRILVDYFIANTRGILGDGLLFRPTSTIRRFRNSGGQEYVLHPGTGPGVRGGSRWPGGTAPGCESPRPVS